MTNEAKIAAGRKAAEWIENGMIVGLGTGSTANCFIERLIERCRQGLRIKAVASSHQSAELAKRGGIDLIDINAAPRIDLTIDGADEIDRKKRLIKGGGGAHLREKILASASEELIIVVDHSKLVPSIGRAKLPVEVVFYGSPSTRARIEKLGYQGKWRYNEDHTLFITENGNLIFDIFFTSPPLSPEEDHEKIRSVPGVVETGFFFNMVGRVVIGYPEGHTEINI